MLTRLRSCNWVAIASVSLLVFGSLAVVAAVGAPAVAPAMWCAGALALVATGGDIAFSKGPDTYVDELNAECDRITAEYVALSDQNTALIDRNDKLGDALTDIEMSAVSLEEAREWARVALDREAKTQVP
jgi:hypothetical protein